MKTIKKREEVRHEMEISITRLICRPGITFKRIYDSLIEETADMVISEFGIETKKSGQF